MERFADKTVVITGAGDMAEVIGERILSEGGKITFADFSEEALKRTIRLLRRQLSAGARWTLLLLQQGLFVIFPSMR